MGFDAVGCYIFLPFLIDEHGFADIMIDVDFVDRPSRVIPFPI